tara:strand:- start:219 stop:434 length:216 start_codon:yes stop_codon:yes gene_type:complete
VSFYHIKRAFRFKYKVDIVAGNLDIGFDFSLVYVKNHIGNFNKAGTFLLKHFERIDGFVFWVDGLAIPIDL